ncbi:hypothetical protein ACFQH9_09790 [Pseudonocardia lutea]|jgi:hypothetical protein|uniref:Uncharacterized protein n=1 Tax=Pseudonocardia lutea TaxID=2172015 RepID=A0ABW1I4G7_9PSEU
MVDDDRLPQNDDAVVPAAPPTVMAMDEDQLWDVVRSLAEPARGELRALS